MKHSDDSAENISADQTIEAQRAYETKRDRNDDKKRDIRLQWQKQDRLKRRG